MTTSRSKSGVIIKLCQPEKGLGSLLAEVPAPLCETDTPDGLSALSEVEILPLLGCFSGPPLCNNNNVLLCDIFPLHFLELDYSSRLFSCLLSNRPVVYIKGASP